MTNASQGRAPLEPLWSTADAGVADIAAGRRPREWACWSASEHECWLAWQEAMERHGTVVRQLQETLNAEQYAVFLEADALEGAAGNRWADLQIARLCRMLPGQADVITWALSAHITFWEVAGAREPDAS